MRARNGIRQGRGKRRGDILIVPAYAAGTDVMFDPPIRPVTEDTSMPTNIAPSERCGAWGHGRYVTECVLDQGHEWPHRMERA